MIRSLYLFESDRFDPYYNLAMEQHLLERVLPGCCTLYLWQNQNTVVIGRNQNAWRECHTALLEQDGGHLARRLSGGGAVFHDLGNLNFTFLLPTEDYDVKRQLSVIRLACQKLGIPAEVTGRNDVTVEGRKFSGNAFYRQKDCSYHHGTLMIRADTERMGRYLSPSKAKLESKGVASVRSRVANLCEYAPDLICDEMKRQMTAAFEEVYGLTAQPLSLSAQERDAVEMLRRHYADWDWLYGQKLPFSFVCEHRFDWGELQLHLQVDSGTVHEVKVYSDAMDAELAPAMESALRGCRFSPEEMAQRLEKLLTPEESGRLLAEVFP